MMKLPMGLKKNEFNIKGVIEKTKTLKHMIVSKEGGEKIFEGFRKDAKEMLKLMKKDKSRPTVVTKLLSGLTNKQMEDLIITDFIHENLKIVLEEIGGKNDQV